MVLQVNTGNFNEMHHKRNLDSLDSLIGLASKQPRLLQYNVILKNDITARCYLTPKSQTQKPIKKTNDTFWVSW